MWIGDDDSHSVGAWSVRFLCSDGDGSPVVEVTGELDAHTGPRLREAIVGVLKQFSPRRVYVDVGAVSFVDSSGLSVLAGSYKRAQLADCEMCLCSPRPAVQRVLELTGLAVYIPIESRPSGAHATTT